MNLEMQVNKTQAGIYTVTYGYKVAPLDVQEMSFAAKGLDLVSPARLGFLKAKDSGIFNPYSRTNADVIYDDRKDGQVVIVPDGAISTIVGIFNLVDAHRKGTEYIIPKHQKGWVYAMVDEMLKNGIAFTVPHGLTQVSTSQFGNTDLTSRLFSNHSLGIEAQEYGDWLQSKGRNVNLPIPNQQFYILVYPKYTQRGYLWRITRILFPTLTLTGAWML